MEFTGHHFDYIYYLAAHWKMHYESDKLTIVVSPEFIERNRVAIGDFDSMASTGNIKFKPITQQEAKSLIASSRIGRGLRRLKEWRLLCKYSKLVNADHCLIMFIDKLQLPIILGLKPPCSFSGIYFQPSFHYKKLHGESKKHKIFHNISSLKEIRDFVFLFSTNKNAKFKYLFTLDPYAVKYIKEQYKDFECIHLADPIEPLEVNENLSVKLNNLVQPGRTKFLIFGCLDERKGVSKFLTAIEALPSEICEKICLILVGQLDSSLKSYLPDRIKCLSKEKLVQFICDFDFVDKDKVCAYFDISDIVLSIYQNHIGMSGILLLAALFNKPVLSQNYGLMGKLVKTYNLGLTVDSTKPEKIAESIKYILNSPLDMIFDVEGMIEFSAANSADKFARTILDSFDDLLKFK